MRMIVVRVRWPGAGSGRRARRRFRVPKQAKITEVQFTLDSGLPTTRASGRCRRSAQAASPGVAVVPASPGVAVVPLSAGVAGVPPAGVAPPAGVLPAGLPVGGPARAAAVLDMDLMPK